MDESAQREINQTINFNCTCCRDAAAANLPHIGENGNWYVGEEDTGITAQGPARAQ